MRLSRLVGALLLLASVNAWATNGDCTVSSIGSGANAAANVNLSPGTPATILPGDLMVYYSGTNSATGASTNNPTNYTLLKQGSAVGEEVWIKVAGRGETAPTDMQWNNGAAGFITAIHNDEGWKNEASILGDSTTGNQPSSTYMWYGALTVTQGGNCAFQFSKRPLTTGNTNQVTSVDVTSGYTAAGFAARNVAAGVVVSAQFFTTDATTPDLAQSNPNSNTNTDVTTDRYISLTMLSGDKEPASFTSFTDVTNATVGTVYTHAATTVSGFDNWTTAVVTGTTCELNPGGTGWASAGTTVYLNVAETFQVRGTAPASGQTLDCAVTLGTATSDTFSITSHTSDSVPDAYNWSGDVTLQALNTTSDFSNIVTIAGLDTGVSTAIAIKAGMDTGCAYSKNGAATTTSSGTVVNDDTVKLAVTTSTASSTAKNCNTTIGTVDGTTNFTATTADFTPAAYDTFTDNTGVTINSTTCSDAVALSGLTGAAAVSVDIGTCRVNSASYTALTCGTASNTDTVQMCHTASGSYATDTTQTMSIGPVPTTATFKSTTEDAPSATENPILFSDLFTGSNGTALTSHTPTSDVPGHGYTKIGSGTLALNASNQLSAGQQTYAEIDTDETVLEYDVDWVIPGASSQSIQAYGRYTDANNYFLCQYTEDTDQIFLRKRIASVNTTFQTITNVPITEATHKVGMFFVGGDQVGCLLDGVEVLTVTDTALNSVQNIVFGALGAAGATFDNLYVKHAYQAVRSDTLLVPDDPQGLFQGETTLSPLTYFWESSTSPPQQAAHPPIAVTFYEGGSWYISPEAAFVGNTAATWERWNPTTSAIETGTLTYTTQGAGLTAAVWQAAAINLSLPIGVPATIDFSSYLTTRGVLAAVCSINSDFAGMSFTDPANCIYSGTPTGVGYTVAQSKTLTATNVTGAPTKAATFTLTGDGVPDFPPYTAVTGATPSASAVACPNTVTLTQTNIPYAITVAGDTGCKYVKDGGAAASTATTGVDGTTLALQVNAGTAGQTKVCTATAGGVSQSCTVTASPAVSADVNDFSFGTVIDVALIAPQSSCTSVTGNTAVAAVTVSGGTCTIDGGTCPGNLPIGGGEVCALHTSSASNNAPTNTVVTISGKQGTFTSITIGAVPDCTDLPTLTYVVDDPIVINLDDYCSNVTSYGGDTNIASGQATRSGSDITGVATTAGPYENLLSISNNLGSKQVGLVIHVKNAAGSADACVQTPAKSKTVRTAVGTAVRSASCVQ